MTKVRFTTKKNVHGDLDACLKKRLGTYELDRNEYGKPYVRGNALYFNVSHKDEKACFVVSSSEVGIDVERLDANAAESGQRHSVLYDSYPDEEKKEIKDPDDAIIHFAAREAFVKMLGDSICRLFRRVSYVKGKIRLDGVIQNVKLSQKYRRGYVAVVCESRSAPKKSGARTSPSVSES